MKEGNERQKSENLIYAGFGGITHLDNAQRKGKKVKPRKQVWNRDGKNNVAAIFSLLLWINCYHYNRWKIVATGLTVIFLEACQG